MGMISDPESCAGVYELNKAPVQLKEAYGLMNDGKTNEANALLKTARAIFEKYKDSNKLSADVKAMALYNPGRAALLTDEIKTVKALYDQQIATSNFHT